MRVKFIDISRGIAIICIILGHLGVKEINSFVFTFHVPIFFIISGYFINDKVPIRDFIDKKYKTLITPYIFTCIAIILLATIKSILTEGFFLGFVTMIDWIYASLYGAGDTYLDPFYIKAIGAIWFLLASFWASIFFKVSLKFEKKTRIIMILSLFLIGYWSRKLLWLPFSIQAGCCATLFLYIGYLFKQKENELKKINLKIKFIFTILALIVWINFIMNFESFWLVHCDIGRGIIDIIGSVCACYIILLTSYFIEKYFKKIGSILSFLGKNSLYILCIHTIELNILSWNKILMFISNYISMTNKSYIPILILLKLTLILTITYICLKVRDYIDTLKLESKIRKEKV